MMVRGRVAGNPARWVVPQECIELLSQSNLGQGLLTFSSEERSFEHGVAMAGLSRAGGIEAMEHILRRMKS